MSTEIKESTSIVAFSEIGNDENKYVFTRGALITPTELYSKFLKWCSKLNKNIQYDIEHHDLDTNMIKVFKELIDRLHETDSAHKCEVPLVIDNSVYIGRLRYVNDISECGVRVPYLLGELSVRGIKTLKEANDLTHTYQFMDVNLRNLDDDWKEL